MTGAEYRILLVEDNDDDAFLLEWALKRQKEFGYTLHRVRTVPDALARCGKDRFDVVLLDLNLPGSEPSLTLATLALHAPDPAVIVVSGDDDQQMAHQAVGAGAQDYLVKTGINPHEMCRAIRYAVQRKSAQDVLSQAREDFLTSISHELRTPLTAASAAVELLAAADGDLPSEDRARLLDITNNNLLLLRALMNNLIDSGLAEGSGIGLRRGTVAAAPLARTAARALRCLAATARVTLDVVDHDSATVLADPDRIVQVLINLGSNAISATPMDGRVTIEVEPDGDATRFAVSDSGAGLDEALLPGLLLRRRSAPRDMAAASGAGLGLGLPVSRAVVEAHGSRLLACSTPGEGSVFSFTLRS